VLGWYLLGCEVSILSDIRLVLSGSSVGTTLDVMLVLSGC
jgi:hypothetical protein